MAETSGPTELTPEDIERAVEIFTEHLGAACAECEEEDLHHRAIISAVFAGLVEITYQIAGTETVGILRQMIQELDVPGSPLAKMPENGGPTPEAKLN